MMSNLNELPLEDTLEKPESDVSSVSSPAEVDEQPDLIKVSARSRSTAVAGAIAGVIRQYRFAEVQAIGAGAVNQAVKALAISRGYLERDEIDIVCMPFFMEVDIDGSERTAVRFRVEERAMPLEPVL
jgi:stage V sporulation protein S